MNGRRDEAVMLRWYPPAWRERYGEEMAALMADSLEGSGPTASFRWSIRWAGLRERAHAAGLVGDGSPPFERVRAGALVVLSAWAAFMLAGADFAKLSEHFTGATPTGAPPLATGSYDAVQDLATAAGILVALGALVALPAFVELLRQGGWRRIRRPIALAALPTALLVPSTAGLAAWAHSLTSLQRDGQSGAYSGAFLAWAALVAVTLAAWTLAAIAVARRLPLSRGALRLEAALACAVEVAMILMTAATAIWWAAMASGAPGFLQPVGPTGAASPLDPRLAAGMALMAAASLLGAYGVARIVRSRRGLQPA